jgi:hypothetical protein
MKILEYLKKNAEAFAGIPNAEEVVKAVVDKMQESGFVALANNEKEPAYVDKAQFDDISGKVATLEQSATDLAIMTKANGDLQKAHGDLQDKYKTAVRDSAIKLAALNAKAKSPDDLFKLLDMSKITVQDNDSIEGLDDQIKELTTSKGYLFGDATPAGGGFNPMGGGGNGQKDPEKMNMDEYAQYYNERTKQQ